MVWTTGARGLRSPWFGEDFYEELAVTSEAVDLSRLNNGAPLLNAHNGWSLDAVIGVVERAWLANGEGRALVRFDDGPDAEAIRRKVKSGILRHISVGYAVDEYTPVGMEDGKRILRATSWQPMEISIVPMGFDDSAVIRSREAGSDSPVFVPIARGSAPQENTPMAEPQGVSPNATASAPAPAAAPAPVASAAPTVSAPPVAGASTPSVSEAEIRAAARTAEKERQASIRRAVRAANLGEDFAVKLIDADKTADEARALVLEELAARSTVTVSPIPSGGSVSVTDDAHDRWARGATAHILIRSGHASQVEAGLAKLGCPEKFDRGDFAGLDMVDLARDSLEMGGVKTRGMNRMDLVGKALTHRAGQQTISNFSVATENALNKILLGYYAITPDTWSRFCGVTSVPDFRAVPMYQMGTLASLDEVPEGAPFTNQSVYDAKKESLTATTKGNILALSRQLLVNDDLGVFTQLAAQFGRAAALSVEKAVYALLAQNSGLGPTLSQDSKTLFHADHGNVGTGDAIAIDKLDANFVLMALQTSPGSADEILDLKPEILLVPRGLYGQAVSLLGAEYEGDSNNRMPNRIRGVIRDIVGTGRLSGTARYIFADPAIAPVLMVGFLDGNRTPFLESKEGWRVDGIEWKVRLDFGVAAVGYRGAVYDAGA